MRQLVVAQTQVEQLSQQQAGIRNQLLGNPDLPLEQFPPYLQAKAALDQAQRDLNHTTVRAPLAGNATQVDNIQLGRYVNAGTPVLSVIDDAQSLGGRQSEGNRFHLRRARTEGDDRRRRIPEPHLQGPHHLDEPRHRRAIRDPAAAERQRQLGEGGAARADPHLVRCRTRIRSKLRAGMSAYVSVDTGRSRSLSALLGLSAPAQETPK